jgi:lysozyme
VDSAVFARPDAAGPRTVAGPLRTDVFVPLEEVEQGEAEAPPRRFASMPLGIDLSDYQGVRHGKTVVAQPVATFQRLARLGKVFAIAKSSQYQAESTFRGHYDNARTAGLIPGSYHFFTPRPVADQTRLVLGLVGRVGPGELPPALDVEDGSKKLQSHYGYTYGGTGTAAGTTRLLDDLQKWLDQVEAALGRTPILYTGVIWRDGLRSTRMAQYPLWTIPNRFPMGGWRRVDIFQYGEGPEPDAGLTGVDFNAYNGTIYGLRGLADLGRVGVAITPTGTVLAHAEPDRHIHLLRETSSRSFADTDLMQGGLPGLGGDPVLLSTGMTARLYFRSDGRVIEATQADPAASWDVEDLSAVAGATAAQEPRALVAGDRPIVLFAGDDDDWHLLSRTAATPWTAMAVLSSARRTGSTTLPPASGQPTLYLDPSGANPRVVGRAGPLGHLLDAGIGPSGWVVTDLTATATGPQGSPPAATYSPAVYHGASDTFVVYRALRGELWQIARSARRAVNLSAAAPGSAVAVGHPVCFVLSGDVHVVYRGVDQGIHELTYRGGTWTGSRLPCAEPAASDPTCVADGALGLVTYRAMDGMVRVLRLAGGTWTCEDTVRPGAAPAPPTPAPTPAPPSAGDAVFAALGAAAGRFREMVAAGDDRSAVALARQHGLRDAAALADLVFFGRHPELGGRRLRPDETSLVREWRTVREQVVGTTAEADPAPSGSDWLRTVGTAIGGESPQDEGVGAFVGDVGRVVGDVVSGAVGLLTTAIAAPFAEFLRRLDGLDRAAAADGYDLTARVTAFRKIFYDSGGTGAYPGASGGGWDVLIPGAAGTRPPPSWAAAAADVTYLREHPVQVTRGGQVDIGHLLTGLDARSHPTDISLGMLGFPLVRMRSNLEAATFTGDLGSVVVTYIRGSTRSFRDTAMEPDGAALDKAYDDMAGAADMAGNADAHVIRLQPALGLAANLSDYYTDGVRRRWHGFVDRITLGTFTPAPPAMGAYLQSHVIGTFSGSTERWRAEMRSEIMAAALAYAAAKGSRGDVVNVLAEPRPGIFTPTFWELYWNVSGWALDEFLRRLKTAVKGEVP